MIEDWSQISINDVEANDVVASIRDAVQKAAEEKTLSIRVKHCCEESRYWRLEFGVKFDTVSLDRFANGRSGYRGHYFDSPGAGEQFDTRIMRELAVILREAVGDDFLVRGYSECDLDRCIAGAKTTPTEGNPNWVAPCTRWQLCNWDENMIWFRELLKSKCGLVDREIAQWMNDFDFEIKNIGPYRFSSDRLEIKGQFVTENETEPYIPISKRYRSLQIHCFGAS